MSEMSLTKMKRVPFDLEKAKAGAKLVTRDGLEARFIAHIPDADREYRVVAMVGDLRFPCNFAETGVVHYDDETNYDLFILEEEKEPVIRWLWASSHYSVTSMLYTEQEILDRGLSGYTKIEGTATPFPE